MAVAPVRPILKHFIVRSQAHANNKYLGRVFAQRDLDRGWHGNRVGLTEDVLRLPKGDPRLTVLPTPQATPDPMPAPLTEHYWQWKSPSAAN